MDPTLLILGIAAFVTGFSKFSVGGLGMLIAPILMLAFPGQQALGVMLPMYLIADLMVVALYRREIAWPVLLAFVPLQVLGMGLGSLLLANIDGRTFSVMTGCLILLMMALDLFKGPRAQRWMESRAMTRFIGLLTGLISMLASAGGPLASLYMMSMKLSRVAYVSTRAWSFLFIDLAKIPLLGSLGLLHPDVVVHLGYALPTLLLGAGIGYLLLRHLQMRHFKWLIRLVSLFASTHLILG